MCKKVVIIGGKGSCVDIAEEIEDARLRFNLDIEVLGFAFDDPIYQNGINGWPVLCSTIQAWSRYKDNPSVFFVFGMFRYDIAKERFALRNSYGIPIERYLTFVHPSAYVSRSAEIGAGTIIMSGVTIKNNVKIGTRNFINSGTNIDHDTVVGNDNFFAAHTCIGSAITIGDANFFGLNSSVRTPSVIGSYNQVGMCANVLNGVGDNMILVGNPAKRLIKHNKGGVKLK